MRITMIVVTVALLFTVTGVAGSIAPQLDTTGEAEATHNTGEFVECATGPYPCCWHTPRGHYVCLI